MKTLMEIEPETKGSSLPEWTPDNIMRFWDYWSHRTDRDEWYFSNSQGQAVLNFCKWFGAFGGDVLDYGFARGFLLDHLLKENEITVSGLEFSEDSTTRVNTIHKDHPLWKGAVKVDELPSSLPEGKFDLTFCIEVVEHLLEEWVEGTFEELYRVTKPGGSVVISTPCNEDLSHAAKFCPFCESEFHDVQHQRSWSPEQLSDSMREAGFEVDFCQGINISNFQNLLTFPHVRTWSYDVVKRVLGYKALLMLDQLFPVKNGPSRAFKRSVKQEGECLFAIGRKPEIASIKIDTAVREKRRAA